MSAWSNLPNAHHIDRVIKSVKSHPEIWDAAWLVARNTAPSAVWDAIWLAARNTAPSAAWDAIWLAARNAARGAAWGPIAALIVYDDSSKYLDMPVEQLRVWAILSEDPAAVLLIPAVVAFERIRELECV
jgi:hypothetical protein